MMSTNYMCDVCGEVITGQQDRIGMNTHIIVREKAEGDEEDYSPMLDPDLVALAKASRDLQHRSDVEREKRSIYGRSLDFHRECYDRTLLGHLP